MITNFHTHTYRCGHASGTERDYVLAARDAGIRILGFSDHCPLPFPEEFIFAKVGMQKDEVPDYCSQVLELKKEFAEDIEIHLGFELEYSPAYFSSIMKDLEKYPIEYFIQGQHFIGDGVNDPWMAMPVGADILRRYVDQTIEGMKTGCYLYLAHPDLPNYQGDDKDYAREMRRLCEASLSLDIPLEINLLGIREGRNYPNCNFWEIAGEMGCKVIMGSDAHQPEALLDTTAEVKANELAKKYHLNMCSISQIFNDRSK